MLIQSDPQTFFQTQCNTHPLLQQPTGVSFISTSSPTQHNAVRYKHERDATGSQKHSRQRHQIIKKRSRNEGKESGNRTENQTKGKDSERIKIQYSHSQKKGMNVERAKMVKDAPYLPMALCHYTISLIQTLLITLPAALISNVPSASATDKVPALESIQICW